MVAEIFTKDEIIKRLSISTQAFKYHKPLCEGSLAELVRHGIRQIELIESPEQYDLADGESMQFVSRMCRNVGVLSLIHI